jgi:hypothetical protein
VLRKLLLAVALVLAAPVAAWAHAETGPIPLTTPNTAPANLHGFLLRADDPVVHQFPRTPAFVWDLIRQPGHYEFQLATDRVFDDSSVLYENDELTAPATTVPLQLPWMTGQPYALWARVRFVGNDGKTTPWSDPYGFNMRWDASDVPQQLPAPNGLVRWSPVEGATAYDVMYTDFHPTSIFETTTNVADEREYYTFFPNGGIGAVHWRVRAIRYVDQQNPLKNALPRAVAGPWSPVYTSVNTPQSAGPLTPIATISDTYDQIGQPAQPHELTPGFAWSGTELAAGTYNVGSPLYRVLVYSDADCVNKVFTGAVVGSPAYVPRAWGGPMALPSDTKQLAIWQGGQLTVKYGGSEGANVFDAENSKEVTNEDIAKFSGQATTVALPNGSATDTVQRQLAEVDLWDSGWPTSRYYWTVVPVQARAVFPENYKAGDPVPLEYHDAAVGQDACQAGRVMSFGKISQPVLAGSGAPYVSGITPTGRMVAAVTPKPVIHDSPLVAWEPAVGAQSYEVQWSRTLYPWKDVNQGQLKPTPATSVVLPITQPGTWYYRVRGINPSLPPGAQAMTWSTPVAIKISGQVWKVVPTKSAAAATPSKSAKSR